MQDIEVTFFRSQGPGGQHRNKTETGVRVKHLPTGTIVTATERRSRSQNLAMALKRLEERLKKLRRKKKRRRKTSPTKASVKRRLDQKTRRGKVKRSRRTQGDD